MAARYTDRFRNLGRSLRLLLPLQVLAGTGVLLAVAAPRYELLEMPLAGVISAAMLAIPDRVLGALGSTAPLDALLATAAQEQAPTVPESEKRRTWASAWLIAVLLICDSLLAAFLGPLWASLPMPMEALLAKRNQYLAAHVAAWEKEQGVEFYWASPRIGSGRIGGRLIAVRKA